MFQNTRVQELENQVQQLIAERDDLQDKLKNLHYDNVDLNRRIGAYERHLEDDERRFAELTGHNPRGAGRKPVTNMEDIVAIMDLHNQGNGTTKIYQVFDGRFSKSTIYRIIKKSTYQN